MDTLWHQFQANPVVGRVRCIESGSGRKYRVNFALKVQTNVVTGTTRAFRRTDRSADEECVRGRIDALWDAPCSTYTPSRSSAHIQIIKARSKHTLARHTPGTHTQAKNATPHHITHTPHHTTHTPHHAPGMQL